MRLTVQAPCPGHQIRIHQAKSVVLHHVRHDDARTSTDTHTAVHKHFTAVQSSSFDPSAGTSDNRSERVVAVVPDVSQIKPVQQSALALPHRKDWQNAYSHFDPARLFRGAQGVGANLTIHRVRIFRTLDQALSNRHDVRDGQRLEHRGVSSMFTAGVLISR